VNSRHYLTFQSTFQSEKSKKLAKTSLNVKFFDWDYLHLTALMKESYFRVLKKESVNTINQQCKCQQMLGRRSAQLGLAIGWAKNENKFHVQPVHFHCFFKF
jgi:hypothetical protein